MSSPDLEITGDPGTVWRVGFEPDPWAGTPWIYATDAGLFDGRSTRVGRYCFITHSRTVAALKKAGVFAAHGIAPYDVDAALLKKAEDRVLTRSIARWVYDLRDEQRNELVDGVEFRSRHGDEIRLWALFERSPHDTRRHSKLITPNGDAPVTPDTPELLDAFSRLGLFWHEPE